MLLLGIGLAGGNARAVTVGEITQALNSNYGAITDMTCNIVVNSDCDDYDIGAGTSKYKQAASSKFRVDATSPAVESMVCDGTTVDIEGNQWSKSTFVTTDNSLVGWISRAYSETDILWILGNQSFSLSGGSYYVNGYACYRITSTTYDIYVRTTNYAAVMRIDVKVSGVVKRRYNFGTYSFVESTAYVPVSMQATGVPTVPGTPIPIATYNITYSNININENLSDSVFAVP
jgi:outer membrane lipoprotein-sorting protein